MKFNINNVLLCLLGLLLILCFVLILMNDKNNTSNKTIEPFDPVIDAIENQLKNESPEQLKSTIDKLQQRLIDYGYSPDLRNYVKKTELTPDSGKCIVSSAEDRDKYILKSEIPPAGPRIDLSQYVKKTSIPPEKICPPAPTIDLSAYVKKSTLPPVEKCPPCIAPKVKVSAGLCRECPPPPPCPAPAPCPACNCPPPAPCPTQKECRKCDDVRYIKVPAVITKTIVVDKDGNVVSQKIDSGAAKANATTTTNPTTTTTLATTTTIPTTTNITPKITTNNSVFKPLFNSLFTKTNSNINNVPTTTFPMNINDLNLAQSPGVEEPKSTSCMMKEFNGEFNKYGITGRNESNFIY